MEGGMDDGLGVLGKEEDSNLRVIGAEAKAAGR